jgi:hypothetical protein
VVHIAGPKETLLVNRSDTISFGSALNIPVTEFAAQGNAILGIRDSGKSYTASWLAERLLENGVPFIAFDPVVIWKYLKVPARPNGNGYNVVVAGEGADLDLSPESAPEIVRAAMRENISLILDLYSMRLSKARLAVDCGGLRAPIALRKQTLRATTSFFGGGG